MVNHQQRVTFATAFIGRQLRTGHMTSTPAPDEVSGTDVSLSGQSVLLVEDSWHVAHAIKALLENAGMLVTGPAATLAEAERLMALQTINLAVIDINLQGEMAYPLIDRLHESGVPVVVISGYELLPMVRGKVAAILTKPIRAVVLLRVLRRIVRAHTTH